MNQDTDDTRRLEELRRLQILDSLEEPEYDVIARRASEICGAPISLISLVDTDRQWFKSRVALAERQTPRNWSFCSHAIQEPDAVMVVSNAVKDSRFKDNPLVTGNPNVRFYAGAPLVTPSGEAIGSLCVMDSKPRELSPAQLKQLQVLAAQVVAMMEKRAEFTGLFGKEDGVGRAD